MTNNNQDNINDRTLLLATNHRFFVRYTVTAVLKVVISTIIVSIFAYLLMIIATSLIEETTYTTNVGDSLGIILVILIVLFAYIIYVLTQIAKVFTLHKKITEIEKENVPNAFLI